MLLLTFLANHFLQYTSSLLHHVAHNLHTKSDNTVRELIPVEVLHTSLLDITGVAFKVLRLGSYVQMPAPSPPFKTILELVLWNGLQSCRRITSHVSMSSKFRPFNISFIFGNRKNVTGG
jgi:hypothetical protein